MFRLNAYLHFKNSSREAMEFYKTVLDGTLTMTTFKEGGLANSSDDENKIMHAMLEAENGMVLMASDTPSQMSYDPGDTVTLSLSGDDEAVLRGFWDKLAVDAKIEQPLSPSPWGDHFGMLVDKFGINWMVNIAKKQG